MPTGRGSDVMQPMAIPSVGGMVVSLLITIWLVPCLFCAVEEWKWKRAQRLAGAPDLSLQPKSHELGANT